MDDEDEFVTGGRDRIRSGDKGAGPPSKKRKSKLKPVIRSVTGLSEPSP
jgi:hypothetical protein